jgi:hypothetical protein
LQKLSKIFDLSYIQIYAALQNQLSDEETTRVKLQLALLDENASAADYLSKKLATSQGQTSMLSTFLRTLPDANNPFEKWGDYLKAIEIEAKRIGSLTFNTGTGGGGGDLSSFEMFGPQGGLGAGVIAGVNPQINITVELDGKTVTGAITESQVNQSLSGTFSDVSRYNGRGAPSVK